MTTSDWKTLAEDLQGILRLATPPLAITFSDQPPAGVAAFDEPMAAPAPDGRTGRVPAGCVFWIKAAERTFSTVPEDHGNCSVGRFTHGMATLEDIAENSDVGELLSSGWVGMEDVLQIPAISARPGAVTYGPLHETAVDPDVVLIRVNGHQMMVLSDALPDCGWRASPNATSSPSPRSRATWRRAWAAR